MYKRIFTIVIDSVGCGVAPKSHLYGDKDVNTIGNLARHVGGLKLPNMEGQLRCLFYQLMMQSLLKIH